jgi:V8-like Glu-specific endopeptidase
MAITGGIKFFKQSKNLDATAVSSVSGSATVDRLLDSHRETYWRSSGSDDTTTEEIEITFSSTVTIDRLLILDFNGKGFNVMYNDGGVYTHFASVTDMDGSQSNITRTDYAKDSYYAEFTPVSTDKIRIQITTTQTTDVEKYINQVIASEEIATLVGYPDVKKIEVDRNNRSKKTISGKYSIQKSLETFSVDLSFKNYPSSEIYNADIDAMMALHDMENPFLIWACGGRSGSPYFNYTIRGFRLKDVIQVQISKKYSLAYVKNIYTSSIDLASVTMEEHI